MMSLEQLEKAVTDGGGLYVSVQRGVVDGKRICEDLVLFNSPRTGTTLALPFDRVTVAAVRREITASDKKFVKEEKR